MTDIVVTSFYYFTDLKDSRENMREQLLKMEDIKGLIHLAPEGINGMASGSAAKLQEFKNLLGTFPGLADLDYKDSICSQHPFPRWKVELKSQTILYKDEFVPKGERHRHLTPEEWHQLLHGDEAVTVLDTRNYYETKVGKFRDAIDPHIESFTDFADYLDKCELPKEQKTLIYCTGGIRCEKAILDMEQRGFENVYQLEGGILRYIEKYPNEAFEGECFVFDNRVAVDQELAPSETFWICPFCGDPGELRMECKQCKGEALICHSCSEELPVCSKNCAYHYRRLNKQLS